MLKIAVPNKGALSEAAASLLGDCGYRQRRSSRDLVVRDVDNDVEFFYLRPRDIAIAVGEGTLDLGITGRDLLLDSGARAEEAMPLGFGRSSFHFAAPVGTLSDHTGLEGLRIATSYAGVLGDWLAARSITATVVRLDGAVESAVQLGVADAIADVVETGSTLRQAGLEVVGGPILESEGVLVRPSEATTTAAGEVFERRLRGVLVARSYVLMDYDIAGDRVEAAVALTPGLESPTVSPLHREGWVAVRAMVPRASSQQVMDELWTLGARGTFVTDIVACRL